MYPELIGPRSGWYHAPSFALVFLVVAAGFLLAGCGGNPARSASTACSGNNFDEVTLQPGCTTVCAQEPCKVYFRMPPGAGNHLVRGRGVSIGEYPAGQTVFFGSFWHGTHKFIVEGTDAPPAYLSVGGAVNAF